MECRKSRVRLIRSQTGEWAKPNDDTVVEIGDTIFIPEKPEMDYWRLSRDIIAVIAQLATSYLVVDRAGNNSRFAAHTRKGLSR